MRRFFGLIVSLLFPFFLFAQEEVLTNQSILDMIELGFTNDVIIGKIQTTKSTYDTTVEALKTLKERGVSSDIIIAMMHSTKGKQEKDNVEKERKNGIYVKLDNEFRKIYPTVFSGSKTNTLGAALSYGLADAKIKSMLNGERSQNVVETNSPEFYFYFDEHQSSELSLKATNWWFSTASSPNDFVLVKLESKKMKRELEIGKVNLYTGNSIGVDDKSIIKFDIEPLSETEFKVSPVWLLEPGEYCFYYQGIVPVGGFSNQAVFDFSIPNKGNLNIVRNHSDDLERLKGKFVWVLKNGKPKQYVIVEVKYKEDGCYYGLAYNEDSRSNFFVKDSECYKSKKELKQSVGMD